VRVPVWRHVRAVCKSVISQIDAGLTTKQREDVTEVEKEMRKWCDTAKGKDKQMCYYMGVGDATEARAQACAACVCTTAACRVPLTIPCSACTLRARSMFRRVRV